MQAEPGWNHEDSAEMQGLLPVDQTAKSDSKTWWSYIVLIKIKSLYFKHFSD